MQQLRAARELYSETGDPAYLSVIDAHLHTINEVDTRRRIAEARRAALLELRQQEALNEYLSEDGVKPDVSTHASTNGTESSETTEQPHDQELETVGEGEKHEFQLPPFLKRFLR